jgi:hypothetical protein
MRQDAINHCLTTDFSKIHFNIIPQPGEFQVRTAASMKITVFRDVAPCSLVEVYRLIALMMAASTSET